MRRTNLAWLSVVMWGMACGSSNGVPGTTPYQPSSSGGGSDSGTSSASGSIPCDVQAVVDTHCGLCHKDPPAAGAPMPLVTLQDFHAPALHDGRPVFQVADERLHSTTSPMPPVSQDPLAAADLTKLSAWLQAGAPSGAGACSGGGPDVTIGPDGAVQGWPDGTGDGGVTGDGGSSSTGIMYDPINPADCEKIIELRAFDPGNPSDGFAVGTRTNSYECFTFEVPFDGTMQGLQVQTILDNQAVVHHWLLYNQAGSASGNGYYNCTGQHPLAQLLAGWAPGRGDTTMPRGVGLQLPTKASGQFVLEIHYNNSTGAAGLRDRSGARVCATSKLKPNEAAISWLGTEAIALLPGKGQAAGTCTTPQDVTVLSSWPHMHKLGTHMKAELTRAAGGTQTLVDHDFSFDDQRSYDTPVVMKAGDKIHTTCSYDNTSSSFVGFGTDSEAEMCYNFVLAYPAGVLHNGVSLTGTNSVCIDPL